MGLLVALVTWALALGAAVPLAMRWEERRSALIAFGVFAFGALVFSFQIPGVAAALSGRAFVSPLAGLATAAGLCAAAWLSPLGRRGVGPRLQPSAPREADSRQQTPVTAIWIVLFAALAYFTPAVLSALSAPPRGWDVLTYHLPKAVSWLQHGNLGVYGSTAAFYPGNAEALLMSILSTGRDLLAPLSQLPFVALGGAAVYGIARELKAQAGSSAVAAAMFVFAPIVFFQSTIAKDDVVVTALILAGAYFILKALSSERSRGGVTNAANVATGGFAIGLALGTKYSILPFVFASVPVVFFALALGPVGPRQWARAAVVTGLFVAAVLLPAAFWFVRNAIATGNPVAPLSLSPAAVIGMKGLDQQFQFVPRLSSWWIYPLLDRHVNASYSGSAGFGAAFGAFFLPSLAVTLATARRRGNMRTTLTLTALILVGAAGWWLGKHHLPRFLLPVMGLACAPAAVLLDGVTRRARTVLIGAAVVAIAFSAAETLRIVFRDDDITWSYQGGVSHAAFYHMPDLIYALPPGTKILLLSPTRNDFYQTFRYPLVGRLPGNDVVMEDDVGVSIGRLSATQVHRDLKREGIDYVFLRTIGLKPFTTHFDDNPASYRKVYDETAWSYPWYRESFAFTPEGEYLGRGLAITKIYAISP